jgi:type I restriction enzyme R subunit
LQLLNTKARLENNTDVSGLLNVALEDIIFLFTKIREEELILADELKNTLRKTREALGSNFDKKDPEFLSLFEALEQLFKNKKLNEVSQEDMQRNIGALRGIHDKIKELNRRNSLLEAKYRNDKKYARMHKRIREYGTISKRESQIFESLNYVKEEADTYVVKNSNILDNESYFSGLMGRIVIKSFSAINDVKLTADSSKFINNLIVKEYTDQYHGRTL